VSLDGKIQPYAPRKGKWPTLLTLTSLKHFHWGFSNGNGHAHSHAPSGRVAAAGADFDKHAHAAGLAGLAHAVSVVQHRIELNRFLDRWAAWCTWILVGLLAGGIFSPVFFPLLLAGAALAIAAGVACLIQAWRKRPSAYVAACLLDDAANLRDRLSTAVFFASAKEPADVIVLHQRSDATKRLAQVDPPSLFPLRMPAAALRVLILALVVGGFVAYRVNHDPPLMALLEKTAGTHSAISPFVRAVEKDLASTFKGREPLAERRGLNDELIRQEQGASADFSPLDGSKPNDSADGPLGSQLPNNANQSGPDQDLSQQTGNTPGSKGNQKSANDENSDASNGNQQGRSPDTDNSQQSLSQTLVAALKDMFSDDAARPESITPKQESDEKALDAGPSEATQSPDAPQGNGNPESEQPDPAEQYLESKGGTAGQMVGAKKMQKTAPLPGISKPNRVDIDSSGSVGAGHARAKVAPSTAQVPLTDASPVSTVAINGAEQEDLPARYRVYIQRYFDRAKSSK